MRFALIDPRHKRVFDLQVPVQIDETFIEETLRCDLAHRIELNHDIDLWVRADPIPKSFRLFRDGPTYYSQGMLCGRTRLGDFRSLPRFYNFEMIGGWITYPTAKVGDALPRRQVRLRPMELPPPALSIPTTEWRPEALDRAYS